MMLQRRGPPDDPPPGRLPGLRSLDRDDASGNHDEAHALDRFSSPYRDVPRPRRRWHARRHGDEDPLIRLQRSLGLGERDGRHVAGTDDAARIRRP